LLNYTLNVQKKKSAINTTSNERFMPIPLLSLSVGARHCPYIAVDFGRQQIIIEMGVVDYPTKEEKKGRELSHISGGGAKYM
jgi:hypothetical protein